MQLASVIVQCSGTCYMDLKALAPFITKSASEWRCAIHTHLLFSSFKTMKQHIKSHHRPDAANSIAPSAQAHCSNTTEHDKAVSLTSDVVPLVSDAAGLKHMLDMMFTSREKRFEPPNEAHNEQRNKRTRRLSLLASSNYASEQTRAHDWYEYEQNNNSYDDCVYEMVHRVPSTDVH